MDQNWIARDRADFGFCSGEFSVGQVQTSKIAITEQYSFYFDSLADIHCRMIFETVRDRHTSRMIEEDK